MNPGYTETEVLEALDECAKEPVHIPGAIQPIGVLLGCDLTTGVIKYVSENALNGESRTLREAMGQTIRAVLGGDIWHAMLNFSGLADFDKRRFFVGLWTDSGINHSVQVSKGGEYFVIEIESAKEIPLSSPDMLREQSFLINQIQECSSEQNLFNLTCQLLRHVTGFDRVMVYQFDEKWNGIIRAEARKSSMESFLDMRFPHWDIPAQARDIMAKIPLRLIADINSESVPVVAGDSSLPPLDMSYAQSRAASPLHTQYLKNMGISATMTLTIMLDNRLWGMISFHHERAKTAPSEIRQILVSSVLPIFNLKLGLLRDKALITMSQSLESLQSDIQVALEKHSNISDLINSVGPVICSALDVEGLVITSGSQSYSIGYVPAQAGIDFLTTQMIPDNEEMLAIDSLSSELPAYKDHWGDVAGVMGIAKSENRCLMLFRRELHQSINWAGNPAKTIEQHDGNLRLQPRGSFSLYLENTKGQCKAWSQNDKHSCRRLWPLLSVAERQAFMSDLSRQQNLMINELNHRVRNILALVRSVSQLTRQSSGTIESYTQALESRIMALAAAHDIGAGTAKSAVSISQILTLESAPYRNQQPDKELIAIQGEDINIRADIAPIFALVIHELMTNAAKYGALSVATGKINVELQRTEEGIAFTWSEMGGPEVVEPSRTGFGTTLISQAVPYEMNGTTNLEFRKTGVHVTMSLPKTVLDTESSIKDMIKQPFDVEKVVLNDAVKNSLVLILEDNFMIATDLRNMLETMGFETIETYANGDDAMTFLETAEPKFALLDMNLGQGKTSTDVATELVSRGVAVLFVTGYGETISMPPHLKSIPILTKPVSKSDLTECLRGLLGVIQSG